MSLADEVHVAAEAAGLRRRSTEDTATVLGAGNDDLGPGRAYLAALAGDGWMVPAWPTADGGLGLGAEDAAAAARALAEYAVPDLYPFAVGLSLVGPTIVAHGSDEQRRRWLGPIVSGDEIWCQLFSEPDAGSDLAGLRTRADRDGDTWRVNGAKVWASRAHYADWGLLLARTDWSVPKHAGITMFAVDLRSTGIEVAPLRQMNGDSHFNQVFLADVEVPDADRLGQVGGGWGLARSVLALERGGGLGGGGGGGGGGLGLGDPAGLLALLGHRGRADDPVMRQRAVGIYTAAHVSRLVGRRAPGSKLRMAALLKATGSLALDAQGPAGMLDGDEWATTFLTAPSLSIRGGTDEIQRSQIAEQALGLPREPSVDRDVPFGDLPRSSA